MLSACYPYETVGTIQVCLKKNYNDGKTTVCTPDTTNTYYQSGAPVQITNVQEGAAGADKFYVDMTFESKSNGEIYSAIRGQQCESQNIADDTYNKNQLWIQIDARGNAQTVSCTPLQPGFGGTGHPYDSTFTTDNPQSSLLTGAAIRVLPQHNAEGVLRMTDGKAQMRCYFTAPSNVQDAVGTISVSARYYVKDVVSSPLTVSHTSG